MDGVHRTAPFAAAIVVALSCSPGPKPPVQSPPTSVARQPTGPTYRFVRMPAHGRLLDDAGSGTPLRLAIRSRARTSSTFYRGARGLFEFFRDLFRSSGGVVHYVGQWHSHPHAPPFPSPTHHSNAMAVARDPKARCPECVHV